MNNIRKNVRHIFHKLEQETEKPETKDNVGIITENKGTNNARNIRAEEATDSKKLADFKMHNPEIEGKQVLEF